MTLIQSENLYGPRHVNIKRKNAEFLDQFVFMGQYPVHTKFARTKIPIPLFVVVSNDYNQTSMAGMDYLAGPFLQFGEMSEDVGIVASGRVDIDVVSVHPDTRDKVFSEVLAAYFSHAGRCWFTNLEDVNVHDYVLVETTENEDERTLDGKVNILYQATLGIRFNYDIITTEHYKPITDIRTYQIVIA